MKPGENRDGGDHPDRAPEAVDQMAQRRAVDHTQAEDEEAEIGGHARRLGQRALGTLRPADREPCPREVAGEQRDGSPGAGAEARPGQHADQRPEHHDPPQGNADLAARHEVVAATFERQVDDGCEPEQPHGDERELRRSSKAAGTRLRN